MNNKIYAFMAISTALVGWSLGIYRLAYNNAEAKYIKQANTQLIAIQKTDVKNNNVIDTTESSLLQKNRSVVVLYQTRWKIQYKTIMNNYESMKINESDMDNMNYILKGIK
jgi:hypothetical protein